MKYGINGVELHLKLRAAGIRRIEDVKRAVLEQNGQLTVVQQGEGNIRFPIITDGFINTDVLHLIDEDEDWLQHELQRQGYELRDIYLAEYVDDTLVFTLMNKMKVLILACFIQRRSVCMSIHSILVVDDDEKLCSL